MSTRDCDSTRTAEPALGAETIVSSWIAAHNARDLDAMLRWLDADVDFHPLRLDGIQRVYRGHDGVRNWFAHLRRGHDEHRIVITDNQVTSPDHVLTIGTLEIGAERDAAPFCAQHRLANGLIVAAHHYLSDPDILALLHPTN